MASADELDIEDERAVEEIKDAVAFAEASPDPEPNTLFDHIYVDA